MVVPERLELGLLPRLALVGVFQQEEAALLVVFDSSPDPELEQWPILVLDRGQMVREVAVVDGVVVPVPLSTKEST